MASSQTSSSKTSSCRSLTANNIITPNVNQKTFTLSELERLQYEIHRYSSYSPNYLPENILVDCPNDQTSRWSAYTNNPPQYLTLKLKRPAIVRKIKFGKFEKSHVCNIKKFRIYGGLDDEKMVLLLEAGLKNDCIPEVFNLRYHTDDGVENLPIIYLKIEPLLSWGPSFNFSIWYIELHGQDDPMYTGPRMRNYNTLREVEIIKLCLKHFRQQGYMHAFHALQEQTNVHLEHGLISELHKYLVIDGDFLKAENFIVACTEEGLMDEYLNKQDYKHTWQMQAVQSEVKPGTRGGHQLVIDTRKRLLYLYGGWDGYHDLSDMWVYDITKSSWTRLCERSEKCNGPTPRSCHKMVFDPVSENIFILGRYLDVSIRTTDYIKSDFFLYDTRARSWLQICDDTSQVGGPQLVYDHQMCIDASKRTIYIFGGKVLAPRCTSTITTHEPEYSGLFSYHIATNTWSQILVDTQHPTATQSEVLSIKSRFTHCMVFHNRHRKLYVYGGQRGKEDIDDFLAYDVDNQSISLLNKDSFNDNIGGVECKFEPSPGFTLRATIDCERDEIYVFSSLSKTKDRRDMQHIDASNSFWVYSLKTHQWSRIYNFRHNTPESSPTKKDNNLTANRPPITLEPCPRYAHQLVYDEVAKMHYLFGGNPGIFQFPQLRLDDFWILTLEKPKRDEVLRHCRYLIRKLHYEEMTRTDPIRAMAYLRHKIADVIDHNNAEQLNNFHKLATLLFNSDDSGIESTPMSTPPLCATNKNQNGINLVTNTEEDDDDATNPAEDLSLESTTSGTSDAATSTSSFTNYEKRNGGIKRARRDRNYLIKNRRAFLFNKIVKLMPTSMVQPERNLSDFVVI